MIRIKSKSGRKEAKYYEFEAGKKAAHLEFNFRWAAFFPVQNSQYLASLRPNFDLIRIINPNLF